MNDFFSNIDKNTFVHNLEYSKEYEFDRYPTNYKSDINCIDEISLQFFEDQCEYRLNITNSFYVIDFGCSEHTTIYTFKITDNQIELIDRIMAG
ncbi:hypothetical protein [Dysgonomonas sp. Marseille-P4361]|uniref:hypothetical protein n=1 Tax=Dysgonomonas sp. Marseille-P4361 TaxID=2161820 RepID=UPI000D55D6AE|nr:hypothetical protein [Dysgonomonas sp. Marseille-P4361]